MGVFDFIPSGIHNFSPSLLEKRHDMPFINESDMIRDSISIVEHFQNKGLVDEYREAGLEDRMRIATSFFDEASKTMRIDTELCFTSMPYSTEGGYEPSTNSIEINIDTIENPECSKLFNTILHEARHAFQHKAVLAPDSVSINNDKIETWRQNFENYISPWLDYEAYRKQPVESDAFDYADNIVPDCSDVSLLVLTNEVKECSNENIIHNQELLDLPLYDK